jgi:hypothetical protein
MPQKFSSVEFGRQLFESVKSVVGAIERRLTQKIDSTDQLVADLDTRLSRLEALEQQLREREAQPKLRQVAR